MAETYDAYDAKSNRVNVLDSNGSNSTYTYDNKDRLTLDVTSVTNAHTYTYTYDSRDNITLNTETGTRVTMVYDAASRLTTSTSGSTVTTMSYDDNGNLTSYSGNVWFGYDSENRLIAEQTNGSDDVLFEYNAFGQKVREFNGGKINKYFFWGEDEYKQGEI